MSLRKLTAFALCLALGGCGASAHHPPAHVAAVGVPDAAPLMAQWTAALAQSHIALSYRTVSDAAILPAAAGPSIAVVDSPLPATALTTRDLLQIPVGLAAVAVVYNVPGVGSGLRLDAPTLSAILGGRITHWNDAAIAALNPGVALPALAIVPLRRADPSSLTTALADYAGAQPSAGVARTGEAALAAAVVSTAGAIGYVSQAYARGATVAALRNAAGQYVTPTIAATTIAAARPAQYAATRHHRAPPAGRSAALTTSSSSSSAYPMAARFLFVVPRDVCRGSEEPPTVAKQTATVVFFVLGDGQLMLEQLDDTPLPAQVAGDATAVAMRMRCDGRPI